MTVALMASSCSFNKPTEEVEQKSATIKETNEVIKQDLLVLVDMADYQDWRSRAFDADASRRATVCDEEKTLVAKVNDQKAMVLMFDVEVEKMGEFMNEEAMKTLKEQFGAEHSVFAVNLMSKPGEGPAVADVLTRVTMANYDDWKARAFDADADRRATVCDESRTLVGKVSNNEALVMMFSVDLPTMGSFMTEEAMKALKDAFGAENFPSLISRIDQ